MIDLTPTWEQILPTLLLLYRDAVTSEARNTALTELTRMAQLADAQVAHVKAQQPSPTIVIHETAPTDATYLGVHSNGYEYRVRLGRLEARPFKEYHDWNAIFTASESFAAWLQERCQTLGCDFPRIKPL